MIRPLRAFVLLLLLAPLAPRAGGVEPGAAFQPEPQAAKSSEPELSQEESPEAEKQSQRVKRKETRVSKSLICATLVSPRNSDFWNTRQALQRVDMLYRSYLLDPKPGEEARAPSHLAMHSGNFDSHQLVQLKQRLSRYLPQRGEEEKDPRRRGVYGRVVSEEDIGAEIDHFRRAVIDRTKNDKALQRPSTFRYLPSVVVPTGVAAAVYFGFGKESPEARIFLAGMGAAAMDALTEKDVRRYRSGDKDFAVVLDEMGEDLFRPFDAAMIMAYGQDLRLTKKSVEQLLLGGREAERAAAREAKREPRSFAGSLLKTLLWPPRLFRRHWRVESDLVYYKNPETNKRELLVLNHIPGQAE